MRRVVMATVAVVTMAVGAVGGAAGAAGCSSSSGGSSTGTRGSGNPTNDCPIKASGGTPGKCTAQFQCNDGVTYRIDCRNAPTCQCLVGDAGTKTVTYQPAFCENTNDASVSESLNSELEAANSACGWGL